MEHHSLTHPSVSDARKIVEDLFRILGILVRGWRYIAVAVAIALSVAILYLARAKPTYSASARLLVLQQGGEPVNVAGNGSATRGEMLLSVDGFSNTLSTHILIIRSPLIVERALGRGGLEGVSAGGVLGALTVTLPDPTARVLEIGYKTGSREEAIRVVDSVIQSYDQFLKDNYQKNSNGVISLIIKARDELGTELKKLEREYLEFRQKSPAHGSNGEGRTFVSRRLDQWDQAINQATARALQLKLQLSLGRELAEERVGATSVAHALNQLSGLGGDTKFTAEMNYPSGESSGLSYERLEADLGDVEFRRHMTEELVKQLQAELISAEASSTVNEQEVAEAFYADPQVAEITGELRRTRAKHEQAKRLTRLGSDPSITNMAGRITAMEAEIQRLWQRRRPAIVAELAHAGDDATLAQAQTELRALKAREVTLRKECGRVRSDRLGQLREERDTLVKRFGAEHEKVRAIQELIARLENSSKQEATDPTQPQTRALLSAIERGLKSVEAMRAEIEERFQHDLVESKKSEIDLINESNLRNNLDRQRALFNSIVDQLKQAQLVSDYGSVTAQVLNPPTAKESRPPMAAVLAAALVLGLGLGGGLAFVADLFDARLRTLTEIRNVLDIRALGVIPQLSSAKVASGVSIGLVCHTSPRSLVAEAYKATRTSVEQIRRNMDVRVILVTSPQSGDGKSTTVNNLAISLAHAGRRVLLIDGDLRRPSLHRMHDLDRSPGLTHLLKNVLPLHRAVQRTQIDGLDLLTAGPDVSNPAELLASPRLVSLVDQLRESYDTVLFDSSPILAVTDPLVLASVVDGIIPIIRVGITRRHDVARCLELLKPLGIPVLGAVINGMIREHFGDFYGYGYNYGYGYGYGYGTNGSSRASNQETIKALEPLPELTVSKLERPMFGTNGTNDHANYPEVR